MHSRHGPSLSLSTRLQSLVNLYKCIWLSYILSANSTYYHSISNCFFYEVYLSRINCTFSTRPPFNSSYTSAKSSQPLQMYSAATFHLLIIYNVLLSLNFSFLVFELYSLDALENILSMNLHCIIKFF